MFELTLRITYAKFNSFTILEAVKWAGELKEEQFAKKLKSFLKNIEQNN